MVKIIINNKSFKLFEIQLKRFINRSIHIIIKLNFINLYSIIYIYIQIIIYMESKNARGVGCYATWTHFCIGEYILVVHGQPHCLCRSVSSESESSDPGHKVRLVLIRSHLPLESLSAIFSVSCHFNAIQTCSSNLVKYISTLRYIPSSFFFFFF